VEYDSEEVLHPQTGVSGDAVVTKLSRYFTNNSPKNWNHSCSNAVPMVSDNEVRYSIHTLIDLSRREQLESLFISI